MTKPLVPIDPTGLEEIAEDLLKPYNPPVILPSAAADIQGGFYRIDKTRILSATTPEYRKFLRESGYGDLDSCSGIGFAKSVLKYDQSVRDAARRAKLLYTGNDGEYVTEINQSNARKLVEALGCKVPTTALMYRLFIPYIKELAQQGNAEAQATLNEMTGIKSEWLEDLVKDKRKVCIGTQEKRLSLPDNDGRFDRADINEFGYPMQLKSNGEFYHWHVSGDERAAVRGGSSVLGLDLDGVPSIEVVGLGVRPQKIF